jgi:hypothetical protein
MRPVCPLTTLFAWNLITGAAALRLFVDTEAEQQELGEDEFRHILLPPLTFLPSSWLAWFPPPMHTHEPDDSEALDDLSEQTLLLLQLATISGLLALLDERWRSMRERRKGYSMVEEETGRQAAWDGGAAVWAVLGERSRPVVTTGEEQSEVDLLALLRCRLRQWWVVDLAIRVFLVARCRSERFCGSWKRTELISSSVVRQRWLLKGGFSSVSMSDESVSCFFEWVSGWFEKGC